jgi:hypothetical protein
MAAPRGFSAVGTSPSVSLLKPVARDPSPDSVRPSRDAWPRFADARINGVLSVARATFRDDAEMTMDHST